MSRSVEMFESHAVTAKALPETEQASSARMMTRTVAVTLALMFALGFALRLTGISAAGFAEDEINKLEAIRAYEHGDITPNAEHPMLMKAMVFVSLKAAQGWNARSAASQISDEAALRFPNVLLGALTVLPLFLLTAAFFDRRTGLVAAALWTFGVNAITYNRIAKEDTLLVFFMLFAFYFYLRAKQASGYDAKAKRRNYALSGISFGLMMASKYFPHYFGLNALYHALYRVRVREAGEPTWKTPWLFYVLIVVVFLIANPAVLLPQTWNYLQAYSTEVLLKHTGYLIGETLYKNNASATPFWGTPLYFYLLFLAIKVPVPVIIAFVVGLVACVKRWRKPGEGFLLLMFVLWIVPYSLFGAKWLRYTLSLLPFVYMIAAVGITALCGWMLSSFEKRGAKGLSVLTYAALLVFFIALPAWSAYASNPHYSLYMNAIGSGRAGYFFPHDEFYDDGLREAISFVCQTAPQGAAIVHETPGVVHYYLQKFGREDLQSRVLSDAKFNLTDTPRPAYIIIQRGRTYFENQQKIADVRARFPKVNEVFVQGVKAAEIYVVE